MKDVQLLTEENLLLGRPRPPMCSRVSEMFCCQLEFEALSPLLRGRFREPDEIVEDGLVSVLTEILPISVATGIFGDSDSVLYLEYFTDRGSAE